MLNADGALGFTFSDFGTDVGVNDQAAARIVADYKKYYDSDFSQKVRMDCPVTTYTGD